ncbi:39S ribosomal protein L22, mitochondrial-like isoform X2 [Varroa jacobsoni]|uniref:Large ribosomal subunit protein uL22m n=1 Tax=Varroa destructor TaxID=109461 RepID=A0A7M7L1A1_VARDE|nr:39S ribosomal protein L22, mitochondrial-like isoform X2 [Varroa destructor]XP_022689370.1 39S ribosomal protein L22, mitochondrial-like isoform X2 [Varroa jacobsoni]
MWCSLSGILYICKVGTMFARPVRGLQAIARGFYTSHPVSANAYEMPKCRSWEERNTIIHSPEEAVNPYVCHYRAQNHYSVKKFLPITWKIRGLSIDDAIAQMEFDNRKGAKILKEVLEEAQDLAVKKHNIEFRSNLWVAEAFATKGQTIKGLRKHGRARFGIIEHRYAHVYVRLEEGQPPKWYYDPPLEPDTKLRMFAKELEERYVMYSI